MSASFILTSLIVGHVIGWGLHLFDCSFPGFGPILDAPPCFITYPPVPDFHIGDAAGKWQSQYQSPLLFYENFTPPKNDNK